MSRQLPAKPNLEHLKNEAKRLLEELRARDPDVQLADALHAVARDYGFASWPKLKSHVELTNGAAGASVHPLTGRWIADLTRSTQHPLNDAQRIIFDVVVVGSSVTIVDVTVDTAGREQRGENTLTLDGEEYLAAGGSGYSIAARWVGPRALEAVTKKRDAEVGRVTYAVSADGATLTLSAFTTAHDGYPDATQTVIFVREPAAVSAAPNTPAL